MVDKGDNPVVTPSITLEKLKMVKFSCFYHDTFVSII